MRLLATLAALLSCWPAAPASLDEVLTVLSRHEIVRARYQQLRSVPGLKRNFTASGQLVFARRQGVLLRIDSPRRATLLVTPELLLQRSARGVKRLRLEQSPFGPAAAVLGHLASGDLDALRAHFEVGEVVRQEDGWQLQLTPRAAPLSDALLNLRLAGDEFLRTIEFNDARGGRTLLRLTEHRTEPDALQPDELAEFRLAD